MDGQVEMVTSQGGELSIDRRRAIFIYASNAAKFTASSRPNGSGKTTTLKIILGLASPTRGQAKTIGRDTSLVEGREALGFFARESVFLQISHRRRDAAVLRQALPAAQSTIGPARSRTARAGQPNECAISTTKHLLERNVATNRSRPGADQPTKLVVFDEPTGRRRSVGSRHICDLIVDLSIR